jgi:ribosome-binding factor A
MADSGRARRLAGRIKQIVASTLEMQVKDPRLGMVTITEVRLTRDCHDATVFYTVLGSDFERAESAAALESARGVLRSEVGRQTGVRFTPTIRFVLDALPDNAHHIDELLAVAARADAEVLAVRAGAVHAGDPDPYRKPRELGDGEDDLDDLEDEFDDDEDDVDDDEILDERTGDDGDDGDEHE